MTLHVFIGSLATATLLVAGGVYAQESGSVLAPGTVAGTVLAADDNRPIVDALVTLVLLSGAASRASNGDRTSNREVRSARSDAFGRYRFTGVAPGRYRLVISHPNYVSRVAEVEVRETSLNLSATLEQGTQAATVRLNPTNADTVAVITGRVTDAKTGNPIAGVEVTVEGTDLSTFTDADGRYSLAGVPPGPQTLRTRRLGYAASRVAIVVPLEGTLVRDIVMAASALLVEGILVTADPAGRARGELGTASVIDLDAIDHQTATSLQDVLELIPGVPLEPPGLDGIEQVSLRAVPTSGASLSSFELSGGTSATDLAAFGTLLIVDGVPQSNNVNLQTLGPRAELSVTSTAAGGVDLRRIPASTLERVEVIRGIPSARWGDFTQGAIVVETRAGRVEPELKGQFDARTTSVSLVGGQELGSAQSGTATFDFAGTRTSPGSSDDYSYRVAGQLMHRADIGIAPGMGMEPKLRLDTRFDFFQLFDDRPANPRTGQSESRTSRDRAFKVTERAQLRLSDVTRFRFTGAYTSVQQRSAVQDELVRGAMPVTDRMTEGRQEGRFLIGAYMADVAIEGNPQALYTRFELDNERRLLGLSHRLRTGAELRREWNAGDGVQFDVELPLQVQFNGVNGYDRPRSNDGISPLATSAIYVDDRIRKSFGKMLLQVQAGLRLEMLHGGSFWWSNVRDAVLQPRINVEFAPAGWIRLRGGWGRTAKTPSLATLSPDPQYYDVINVNHFTNDPVERLAVLTTFIEDPTNPDLGFSRATKAEAGIEFGIAGGAVSLVAFRDEIDGAVGIRSEPISITREHFALTDSVVGNGIKPDIIEPAERTDPIPVLVQRPDNVIDLKNVGAEITAFLPELPVIRTRFQVTGSWVETKLRTDALYFGTRADFENFQLQETVSRTPYWDGATEVGRAVLLTYRVIHHQVHAGLLITATIQHNVTEKFSDVAATDTLAFRGYLTRDAELVPVPESERANDEFRDLRVPRGGTLIRPESTPADWFISLQVSKTLPLDGRLNFWAFNMLDKRGVRGDLLAGVRSRPYRPVRVGLEVSLPVSAFFGLGR